MWRNEWSTTVRGWQEVGKRVGWRTGGISLPTEHAHCRIAVVHTADAHACSRSAPADCVSTAPRRVEREPEDDCGDREEGVREAVGDMQVGDPQKARVGAISAHRPPRERVEGARSLSVTA